MVAKRNALPESQAADVSSSLRIAYSTPSAPSLSPSTRPPPTLIVRPLGFTLSALMTSARDGGGMPVESSIRLMQSWGANPHSEYGGRGEGGRVPVRFGGGSGVQVRFALGRGAEAAKQDVRCALERARGQ